MAWSSLQPGPQLASLQARFLYPVVLLRIHKAQPSPPLHFHPSPIPEGSRTDTLLHFRASRSLPPPSPPPHSRPLREQRRGGVPSHGAPCWSSLGTPPHGSALLRECRRPQRPLPTEVRTRCGRERPGPTVGRRREVEPGRSTSSVYWGLARSRGRAPSGTSSPGGHGLQSQALGRVRAAAREGLFLSPVGSGC